MTRRGSESGVKPRTLARLVRWVGRTARGHWVLLSVLVAVAAYTALLGWVLAERYWAFQTYAWDLGVYNQAMYTSAFSHRLFYYTSDLPSGNNGLLFVSHFSPVLFLLLPFYLVSPNPPGLLVIQSAALAAGAIPLYFLSRRTGLSDTWTLLVVFSYILSPVLMGIGWYDFHPEAFLPVTVLLAVYCYYYAGRWAFIASWLLCLSVIETIAPLLFLFAVAGIVALLLDRYRGLGRPRQAWEKTITAAIVTPIWLGVAALTVEIVGHTEISTLTTGYSGAFTVLGPNLGFISVVPYALLHPAAGFAALSQDWHNKLAYVLVLLGAFAFVPLFGPRRLLLPTAAWLVLVSLSNGPGLYEFGDQYAAYAFPFLAAGMPFGLARLRQLWWARPSDATAEIARAASKPRRFRLPRRVRPIGVGSVVVLALIVTLATVSPLLSRPSWTYGAIAHGIPTVTAHDQLLHTVIGMIPSTAPVLTVSAVFPEVSDRIDAFVVPITSGFQPNLTFDEGLNSYVNESEYILLDFYVDFFGSSVLVRFANLTGFGVRAEADKIVLLEKGWTGPPSLWTPIDLSWCAGQLGTTASSFVDSANATSCGPAISSVPQPATPSKIWYGSDEYGLTPGEYSATFWISAEAQQAGTQLGVEVDRTPVEVQQLQTGLTTDYHQYGFRLSTGSPSVLNSSNLTNPSSGPKDIMTNLTVTFYWSYLSVFSVTGWVYSSSAEVRLIAVTLQQLSP